MIRTEEIATLAEAAAPELAGRIGYAAEWTRVVEEGQLPQVTPAAFVLPGGITGGGVRAATGLFIQDVSELVSLVLVVRVAGDATGAAAVDEARPIVAAVIGGVLGKGPDDAPGVWALSRAELVGSQDSALIFQIDFTLQDQLRIAP